MYSLQNIFDFTVFQSAEENDLVMLSVIGESLTEFIDSIMTGIEDIPELNEKLTVSLLAAFLLSFTIDTNVQDVKAQLAGSLIHYFPNADKILGTYEDANQGDNAVEGGTHE